MKNKFDIDKIEPNFWFQFVMYFCWFLFIFTNYDFPGLLLGFLPVICSRINIYLAKECKSNQVVALGIGLLLGLLGLAGYLAGYLVYYLIKTRRVKKYRKQYLINLYLGDGLPPEEAVFMAEIQLQDENEAVTGGKFKAVYDPLIKHIKKNNKGRFF